MLKRFLSFRSFIPGCIHEDTPHSAFDALMNHEYLHIILTNVFRYDLHQSVNQMIRWSENVFNCVNLHSYFGVEVGFVYFSVKRKNSVIKVCEIADLRHSPKLQVSVVKTE
jgi:hypothetical protein